MGTKWADRISLFRSARLQLTLFYLGIMVLFNLTVTLSIRVFAEHEFLRSNVAQRSEVRDWAIQLFEYPGKRSEVYIADIQAAEAELVRQHLNQGLLVINLFAFVLGGMLSYWFAGRALKPLQDAHEAQARFTADASHELRTPLANMRLENEVFLRQKQFSEAEARDQLTSNLEEVQRLERLSNNLLALHQYGRAALIRSTVPAKQIAEAAIHSVRAAAAAKKVHLKQQITPGHVLVHRESMVQLMDILLDNALKYGARGGEVLVRGERRRDRYVMTVEDKGPGLAAKDLPHLFDRLYRGDKARSAQVAGYGLGLALAKEIAEANGATITARNGSKGGACFELSLPLAANE